MLMGISLAPVVGACLWFRLGGFPMRRSSLIAFLLSGAAAALGAALLQSLFPPITEATLDRLLLAVFVRIALTEELGRLILLRILFSAGKRVPDGDRRFWGAAAGLLCGLGFAAVENGFYGAQNAGILLFRLISTAPLHGACGSRVGIVAMQVGRAPVPSIIRFLSAVLLHGMFNLLLLNPQVPRMLPAFLALCTLAASIQEILLFRQSAAQTLRVCAWSFAEQNSTPPLAFAVPKRRNCNF
jgi:RsiW-degrading membrane proteinase PrsW (M82 family)